MKKAIISILLSFSILCSSLTFSKRSCAAGVGLAIPIFTVAWEILDILIKGEEPMIVECMRWCMERVADGAVITWEFFTDPEGDFQTFWGNFWSDWGESWTAIYNSLSDMWGSSDITLTGDSVKFSLDHLNAIRNQIIEVAAKPKIDLKCGYNYTFLSADLSNLIAASTLPVMLEFIHTGEAYIPVYYDDDHIIFGSYCYSQDFGGDARVHFQVKKVNYDGDTFSIHVEDDVSGSRGNSHEETLDNWAVSFSSGFLQSFVFHYDVFGATTETYDCDQCFVYDVNGFRAVDPSTVDTNGLRSGLITTISFVDDFYATVTDYAVVPSPITDDSLVDYDKVLPAEENPSLTFPLSPDLDKPIADQVTVGDIPGVEDLPISDYVNNVANIQVNVPSVIVKKFPFCIPFDLVRFFGVLAADPIPPVFHIPISTHPANLEQWADNEAFGEYVAPDDPMFDIDEEIVLDFAHIPLVQPICYTVFIVGFVILLIHITTKLIQH